MKQFLHLTPEETKGLDVLIYKNALQLKKDAMLIATNRKSYSSATSMLILSSEEAVKSVLVRLHAEHYNIYKLKEAGKFFKDHKIRHQIAQIIEMGSGLIEFLMKYDEQQPTKLLNTNVKWLDSIVNGAIDLIIAAKPLMDSGERFKELQAFNELKNKGFYVDYRDRQLLPQNEVTESIYNRTLLITDRVFKFNKLVRIIFHEKLENHMSKQEINRRKVILEDLIDNGMKEFSFKELNKRVG